VPRKYGWNGWTEQACRDEIEHQLRQARSVRPLEDDEPGTSVTAKTPKQPDGDMRSAINRFVKAVLDEVGARDVAMEELTVDLQSDPTEIRSYVRAV